MDCFITRKIESEIVNARDVKLCEQKAQSFKKVHLSDLDYFLERKVESVKPHDNLKSLNRK